MTSIVSKWQSLSKKEKTDGDEKKTETEGVTVQTTNKNEVPGNNTCITCFEYIDCQSSKNIVLTLFVVFSSC